MKYIKPNKVKKDAIIIDLLSDHSYESEHIKGAKNFSIYEIDFPDKIMDAFPDKSITLYIYGFSNDTKEAEFSYKLLNDLGYENVYIIDDGLKSWKNLNLPIVKGRSDFELDGKYIIFKEKSRIKWAGRNIGNIHVGDIKIIKGHILMDKGMPKEGKIEIDMQSIDNFDLDESGGKKILINHLKSSDFFEVENFPTSTIKLLNSEQIDDVASKPNYIITAELTIKGITNNIMFEAHVREKEGQLVINAHLDIDRSKWNIMYGSEEFFAKLGNHIIDDMISFDVVIYGEKG